MEKIIIINPFGIGDVLFTTPVIRALKENYPQAKISYWCNERVKEIFSNNPYIDKVFALSRGDLKRLYQSSEFSGICRFFSLMRGLKREKFDTAFDFSLDQRYSLLLKMLGVKNRIGFNYKNRGRFLTQKLDIEGYSDKHIVEYYLKLLEFANINKPKSAELEVFLPADYPLRARSILNFASLKDSDVLVGIACGGGLSWGRDAVLKHWPALKFAQLADRITEVLGAKIILLGDPSERYIADIIVAAAKNKPVDLVGKTSLIELAIVIKRLKLLVANDGGPLHLAVANRVKTVSIFGPVDERVYGPYPASSEHVVIKSNVSCRPCYRNFKLSFCAEDKQCVKAVEAEEVFEAVRKIW